jgi:hypothetical protein
MVEGFSRCEWCRSIVPDQMIQEEAWKEYENSETYQKRKACYLCRLVFPVETKRASLRRNYDIYDTSSYSLLMAQSAERYKQKRIDAIKRAWAEIMQIL